MSMFGRIRRDTTRIERLENKTDVPRTVAGTPSTGGIGGQLPEHPHDGTGFGGATLQPAKLKLKAPTTLTLSANVAGVVAVTQSHHLIDTNGGASSGDLQTITGLEADTLYKFSPANGARTIVFKHGAGNIFCIGNADLSLDDIHDFVWAFSPDGVVVYVLFDTQAAGGTPAPVGASYLTLGLDGTLTSERQFTPGQNLFATDGGANGAYTVDSWREGAAIASASTLTLGTDGDLFHVTGTTTITAIATPTRQTLAVLIFDGALTLTHGANLILQGSANHVTAAGDVFVFAWEGGTVWREVARRIAAAHNLLSAHHPDTVAGTVARGDVVVGNATPKWARVAAGLGGQLFIVNGSDPGWATIYQRHKYGNVPDAAVGATVTAGDAQGRIWHSNSQGEVARKLFVDAETAPGASGLPCTWQYGDTNDLDTVSSWTVIATATLSSEKSTEQTTMTNSSIPASRLLRTDWGTIVGTPKDASSELQTQTTVGFAGS